MKKNENFKGYQKLIHLPWVLQIPSKCYKKAFITPRRYWHIYLDSHQSQNKLYALKKKDEFAIIKIGHDKKIINELHLLNHRISQLTI